MAGVGEEGFPQTGIGIHVASSSLPNGTVGSTWSIVSIPTKVCSSVYFLLFARYNSK